jgi:hypothetical protein
MKLNSVANSVRLVVVVPVASYSRMMLHSAAFRAATRTALSWLSALTITIAALKLPRC